MAGRPLPEHDCPTCRGGPLSDGFNYTVCLAVKLWSCNPRYTRARVCEFPYACACQCRLHVQGAGARRWRVACSAG
eukprot:4416062-Alexandrium_andersonii.AAC.1